MKRAFFFTIFAMFLTWLINSKIANAPSLKLKKSCSPCHAVDLSTLKKYKNYWRNF